MLVDGIGKPLHGDPLDYTLDDDELSPEGNEEEMYEDDEPDDVMTLVQFQSEVRKKLWLENEHTMFCFAQEGQSW